MNKLRAHVRWIMAVIIAAFVLSTFFMYGGGSRSRASRSNGADELRDYVVADVNGNRLMRSELERQLRLYLEELDSRQLASFDLSFAYQVALNQYIIERQLADDLKASGITVTDAEADQAMKDYADQTFPTREAFYQYLERSGQTPASYKKNIAQQMATQRLVRESIGAVEIGEDEAMNFYESLKSLFFSQPKGIEVNLIRLASKDDAEKVRNRLLDGVTWNEATSGDAVVSMDVLYVTTEPTFVPESVFDGYLSPMKSFDIGAVSDVFEVASDDFAVGVRDKEIDERITPYDEVSADIRSLLQRQKERESLINFRQGLLDKAKVIIRDESLFPSEASEFLPVTENTVVNSADAPVVPEEPK